MKSWLWVLITEISKGKSLLHGLKSAESFLFPLLSFVFLHPSSSHVTEIKGIKIMVREFFS